MEVLAAVAPAVEVRPADAVDAAGSRRRRAGSSGRASRSARAAGCRGGSARAGPAARPSAARSARARLQAPLVVPPDHAAVRLGARRTRLAAGLAAPRRLREDRLGPAAPPGRPPRTGRTARRRAARLDMRSPYGSLRWYSRRHLSHAPHSADELVRRGMGQDVPELARVAGFGAASRRAAGTGRRGGRRSPSARRVRRCAGQCDRDLLPAGAGGGVAVASGAVGRDLVVALGRPVDARSYGEAPASRP